jgi:hypothetical protein
MSVVANKTSLPDMTFLVGMGRSGTTLLSSMLNSHPELIATSEHLFMLFAYSSFKNADFSDPATVDKFLDLFKYDLSLGRNIWDPEKKAREDILSSPEKDFASVCKLVYLNYPFIHNKTNIRRIVDKNPQYSLHLSKWANTFPEAKYIVLVRDFRDNIASRKRYASKPAPIYDYALAWNYFYDIIFSQLKKNKLSYQVVRYEDLVHTPIEILTKLCQFLGVEYHENMLSFQALAEEMKDYARKKIEKENFEKTWAMHANLVKDLNAGSIGSYGEILSEDDVQKANYLCRRYGKQFGYLPDETIKPALGWLIPSFISQVKVRLFYRWRRIYYLLPVYFRLRFIPKKKVVQ